VAKRNNPQLSNTATALITDPGNEKVVSPASYCEIAIKISIKKYRLAKPYEVFMDEAIDKNGFGYLHILPKHTAGLTTLPFHHKDPFDRLLISQAISEGIPIISGDTAFDSYPVKRLW
jgi:PIN domain nuclease of toxin-antitoxin system